jgi:hypothetical protein
MSSTLACLDTRICSWNCVIENRTINTAEMLLPLPRPPPLRRCRLYRSLQATPCPRARRKRLIAPSKTHKQRIIRHTDTCKASTRHARSITVIGSEASKIASTNAFGSLLLARVRMIRLGNCGDSRWWTLRDGPVDGEMAFNDRLLKKGGEAEALHVA